MRAIRILFYVVLAIVLVLLAAANRSSVTVSMAPDAIAPFVGGTWSITMPAFMALFAAMVFGLLIGLCWEWLREAHLRAESSRRARDLSEMKLQARETKAERPKDDVLAILEKAPTKSSSGATLPAVR